MANKKLSKTEEFIRSKRGTKIGYFLPTLTEYRQMPASYKRKYTGLMKQYNSGSKVDKNLATVKALNMASDKDAPVSKKTFYKAKNFKASLDVIRPMLATQDVQKYGRSLFEHDNDKSQMQKYKKEHGHFPKKYQEFLDMQQARAIRRIKLKNFDVNNLDVRASGKYLYGYHPAGTDRYVVFEQETRKFVAEYHISMRDIVDRMIDKHNHTVSSARQANFMTAREILKDFYNK